MAKNTNKSIEQRRQRIISFVTEKNTTSFEEIARTFHVSEITIRRDIKKLVSENILLSERGGKIKPNENISSDINFFRRSYAHSQQKREIAEAALELIKENSVIGLDSSTTTLELAKQLFRKKNITVVSNSLLVPPSLANHRSASVFCVGGHVMMDCMSTEGICACSEIQQYSYDICFLSANAFDFEYGLSNIKYHEIDTKLSFLSRSKFKVLLLDSGKIGRREFRAFSNLSSFDLTITDNRIKPEHRIQFEALGAPLLIAPGVYAECEQRDEV